MARPTKLTDEVRRKIEEAAAMDCSVEEIAFFADIHRDTLHSWLRDDPKFSDRINELRNKPILAARATILKAIKTDKGTAAWYLERKRKKEFAERKEVTGKDGEPLFDEEIKGKAKGAIASFFGN